MPLEYPPHDVMDETTVEPSGSKEILPPKGLSDIVGDEYDYWEPGKWDSDEPRVKMGTDPALAHRVLIDIPADMVKDVEFWNLKGITLTLEETLQLIKLLYEYQDVFAKDEYDLGRFNRWEHTVDTGDAEPIKAKARPLSQAKLQCLAKILEEYHRIKLIRPSRSDWASNIVMVPKKDGSWRMCMDFRPLNRVARCCQFPLPRINDILQNLRGAKYFSALDLAKGFHQVPLAEDSKHKLAFVTPLGQWEWECTPMGLHSAPGAFQAAMQQTLAGLQHCTMVYVDDIIVFTKDLKSHLEALEEVFKRLREFNLRAARPKCEFARTELRYLGHVVNTQGIQTDPKKVSAVKDMPEPKCILDVESFLGKCGYYQRFIQDYAKVATPLNQLKRRDAVFRFGPAEKSAFETLKKALTTSPILKYPDYSRPFYIATDASGYGLGAVLFQKYGKDGADEMPVAYASRTLKDAELRYSATEREALAVWWACDHFIDYIDEVPVTIYTDHKALLALPHNELNNRRLQLIAHKLAEFRYTIEYRPGVANANADALSRYPIVPCKGRRSKEVNTNESVINQFDSSANLGDKNRLKKFKAIPQPKVKLVPSAAQSMAEELLPQQRPPTKRTPRVNAVILPQPPPVAGQVSNTYRHLAQWQRQVPELAAICQYCETGTLPALPQLRLEIVRVLDSFYVNPNNKVLYRTSTPGQQPVICAPPQIFDAILYDAHSAPAAGHQGIGRTLPRLRERYWWPGMSKYVTDYLAKCPLCLAHKDRPRPPREPLGDRPPPKAPWERLHADVWSPGNPSDSGQRYVLGVVDTFSKYLVLIPMPDQTSDTICAALVSRVFLTYGTPQELVMDNGPAFTADLAKEMLNAFGVTRKVITPYRPQTNGQIERMFRSIRPMLATLASKAPRRWDEYVNYVSHAYNSAYHVATKETPFYVMYGRAPQPLPEHFQDRPMAVAVQNSERLRLLQSAREAVGVGLVREQNHSKEQYDARARPQTEFVVNDCVLIRVANAPRNTIYKLYPKFIGPYKVVEVRGSTLTVVPLLQRPRVTRKRYHTHKDRVRHCDIDFPNIFSWDQLMLPFADPAGVDPNLEEEGPEDPAEPATSGEMPPEANPNQAGPSHSV